uniref:Uncharacterized protein n=1 Tax=Arundo donax TaxID=35708 RepID=A0A0A9DLV1_ARUDO
MTKLFRKWSQFTDQHYKTNDMSNMHQSKTLIVPHHNC